MIRLSTNSSNKEIFIQHKQDYETALKIVDIKNNSCIKRQYISLGRIKYILK